MSNIRLKAITVEPSQDLLIKNGNIRISQTTPSTSVATGAMIIEGGIAISCSTLGYSSTNGGALTVAGSVGIVRDAFLGGNLGLENPSGTLSLAGTFSPRLFFDSVTGANMYISTDGINQNINVTPSNVSILTKMSATGQVSLLSTSTATSVTAGGSLTVSGGFSLAKNMIIGGNSQLNDGLIVKTIDNSANHIEMLNQSSQLSTLGINSSGNLIMENQSSVLVKADSGNITFNVSTSDKLKIDQTTSTFYNTISAQDFISSGLLFLSNTSGNALSMTGGILTNGTIDTQQLKVNTLVDSNKNKIVLYNSTNSTTIGTTVGNMLLSTTFTSGSFIFQNGSTDSVSVIGSKINLKGISQSYSIFESETVGCLAIQSQTIATPSILRLFTSDGDGLDDLEINLVSKGLPGTTITEYMKLGYTSASGLYSLYSYGKMQIGVSGFPSQIILSTSGSISTGTTSPVSMYNLSLSSTTQALSSTEGGSLSVSGGGAFNGTLFVKDTLNVGTLKINSTSASSIFSNLNSNPNFYFGSTSTTNTQASISVLTNSETKTGTYSGLSIDTGINSFIDTFTFHTVSDVGSTRKNMLFTTNNTTSQLYLSTTGNVGIYTSSPSSTLTVAGSLTALQSTLSSLTLTGTLNVQGNSSTFANAVLINGIVDFSTQANFHGMVSVSDQTDATFGSASISTLGGIYATKKIYTETDVALKGNLIGRSGTFSTLGSLNITENLNVVGAGAGISTFQSTQNSTSITSGSLILKGGLAVTKDIFLNGQQLNAGITTFSASGDLIRFTDFYSKKRYSIGRGNVNDNFKLSRYDSNENFLEDTFEISSTTGSVILNNATISAGTSGSLIVKGGITIVSTTDATSTTSGGTFTSLGGMSVQKSLIVGGDTFFNSTTASTLPVNGAVTIAGGLGVQGNFNLLGNAVINGNLTISGSTTSVASTNLTLADNLFVLNSGPSGSKDSGILIERFQMDNDTGSGDVVADTPALSGVFPGQGGMTTSQVKLGSSFSSVDSFYNGWWIEITSGFSNNQVRKITAYDGTNRIATLSSIWTSQNPSIGDSFNLYNKPLVGLVYSEIRDRFEFGSTLKDPGNPGTVSFTDSIGMFAKNISVGSTTTSIDKLTGSLITNGGIAINTTVDSVNSSSGSGLTVAGGASIAKTLYIGNRLVVNGIDVTPGVNDIPIVTFSGQNNVSNQDITGAVFGSSVWGFDLYLLARVVATTNSYSNYHIRGINRETSWEIITEYVGDSTLQFNITTSGQLQYTSFNYPGFVSLNMRFKAYTE